MSIRTLNQFIALAREFNINLTWENLKKFRKLQEVLYV